MTTQITLNLEIKEPFTFTRKYHLGTRFINQYGIMFRYCKIDGGILQKKTKKQKEIHYIQYGWLRI